MFRKSAFQSMIFRDKKRFRRVGPDIIRMLDDILCKLIAVNQGILPLFIFASAFYPKPFGQQDNERRQEQKRKQKHIIEADV